MTPAVRHNYSAMTSATYRCSRNRRFRDILWILREANTRYDRVAHELRCSLRLSHHARSRAYYIGLTIDIDKAHDCPQRVISVEPLPVLDQQLSPQSLHSEVLDIRTGIASAKNDVPMVLSPLEDRREKLTIVIPSALTRQRMMCLQSPKSLAVTDSHHLSEPLDFPIDVRSRSSSIYSQESRCTPGAPLLLPVELPASGNDYAWMNEIIFSPESGGSDQSQADRSMRFLPMCAEPSKCGEPAHVGDVGMLPMSCVAEVWM